VEKEIMQQNQETKSRINNWLASLLILVSICIVSNVLSVLLQRGAFKFWTPLPDLSSPVTQIVDADPFRVWVKTVDNKMYTAHMTCSNDKDCHTWALVKDVDEIHAIQAPNTVRETNCEGFDRQFPKNPSGKVLECIETYQPAMPEGGGFRTYYALMSDGTVEYWQLFEGSFLMPFLCVGIPSIVCPPIGLLLLRSLPSSYSRIKGKAG
jgi:hypothetical protein